MSDLIHRHMAVAACAIGPSDEWSKSTRSGYEQAALDCVMNILRIESEPSQPLAALAMRERAAAYMENPTHQGIRPAWPSDIRALPTTFTDAELLAAAMQLPEVRALMGVLSSCRPRIVDMVRSWSAEATLLQKIDEALAPFMKGGDK